MGSAQWEICSIDLRKYVVSGCRLPSWYFAMNGVVKGGPIGQPLDESRLSPEKFYQTSWLNDDFEDLPVDRSSGFVWISAVCEQLQESDWYLLEFLAIAKRS